MHEVASKSWNDYPAPCLQGKGGRVLTPNWISHKAAAKYRFT